MSILEPLLLEKLIDLSIFLSSWDTFSGSHFLSPILPNFFKNPFRESILIYIRHSWNGLNNAMHRITTFVISLVNFLLIKSYRIALGTHVHLLYHHYSHFLPGCALCGVLLHSVCKADTFIIHSLDSWHK